MVKIKRIFSDIIFVALFALFTILCIGFACTEISYIAEGIFAVFAVIVGRAWMIIDDEKKRKLNLSLEAEPDCEIQKTPVGLKVLYKVHIRNLGLSSVKIFDIWAVYNSHGFYPSNGEIPVVVENKERVIEPNHHETFVFHFFRGHEFPDEIVIETAIGQRHIAKDVFKKHIPFGNIKL